MNDESNQHPKSPNGGQSTLEAALDAWSRMTFVIVRAVFMPVRRHWRLALVTFLAFLAITTLQAFRTGYLYASTATLILSPPAYQSEDSEELFRLMEKPFDVPTYVSLLQGADVLERVAQRCYAENPDLWEELHASGNMVPEVLRNRLTVSSEVVSRTSAVVNYSRVIRLEARGGDPAQVKSLLDAWVAEAVETARSFTVPSSEATVAFIREEYNKTKLELESIENTLLEHQKQWDVDLLEKIELVKKTRLDLAKTELYLAQQTVKEMELTTAKLKAAMETEPIKVMLQRHPDIDALTIVEGVTGDEPEPAQTDVWSTEEINPVYTDLGIRLYTAEESLAAALGRVAHLEEEVVSLENEIKSEHQVLVEKKLTETQLMRDIEARVSYFTAMAARREEVAALEGSIKLAEAGAIIVANKPVIPHRPSNSLTRWGAIPIGIVIGLIAAVAVANIRHEYERVAVNPG